MKYLIVCMALLAAGCAAAPKPTMEQVGLRTVASPTPSCQAGHENALADGALIIEPGQTLCVDLHVDGTRVEPVRIVTTADPKRTLIIRFWNEPGTDDMYLTLHNPLPSTLRYHATMRRSGSYVYEATSVCDILSKRLAIEHWPYPIAALHLSGFSTTGSEDRVQCR
ncbi:hypothetical protein [Oleiagrimonas soli]|nr:hypothetical protein [Oleiagrimonas soli]MBB6185386.1 hypothetical protein [Oleiagrimonas soli]